MPGAGSCSCMFLKIALHTWHYVSNFCEYIPYLSKLYSVDKKQWKVGVRLAYDRHCTREDDSDLREKNKTKQKGQNFRSQLDGQLIPCRKSY